MKKSELKKLIKESINEVMQEESDYKEKFQELLKKYGVKSPKELKDDKVKEFWNDVDAMQKTKEETK